MTELNEGPQFEPYQQYLASIRQIEDLAEQSRFSFQITQRFVNEPGTATAKDDVFARTTAVLNTSCFLMEWLHFNTFLKNTIYALLQMHSSKLSAGNATQTITYAELELASHAFSSIDRLRNQLIVAEIERQHPHSQSAQGLIEYLRRVFHFQVNPYEIEFLYKGQRTTTSVYDLDAIRAMYKRIVGDTLIEGAIAGSADDIGATEPTTTIGEEEFLRAKAILNAMAASIADTILNKWYDLS